MQRARRGKGEAPGSVRSHVRAEGDGRAVVKEVFGAAALDDDTPVVFRQSVVVRDVGLVSAHEPLTASMEHVSFRLDLTDSPSFVIETFKPDDAQWPWVSPHMPLQGGVSPCASPRSDGSADCSARIATTARLCCGVFHLLGPNSTLNVADCLRMKEFRV